MTASIPGENDTKGTALPFFLSACHLMPASKSGGVPSERAPVVWTVGQHRASSSCMRAEQHTREKCTAPPSRPKFAAAALVHSAESRLFKNFDNTHNTSRIRIQLAERRRFISRMMCLRPGGIAFHITPLRPARAVLPPTLLSCGSRESPAGDWGSGGCGSMGYEYDS